MTSSEPAKTLEPVGEKMCGSLLICIEGFSCTEVPSCKWRFPHVSSIMGLLPNHPSLGPFEYPMVTTGDSPRNKSAEGPSLCPEPRSPWQVRKSDAWFWFIWVLKMGKNVCIPPNCMLFGENDVKLVNHFFLGPYFQTNPFWVVWKYTWCFLVTFAITTTIHACHQLIIPVYHKNQFRNFMNQFDGTIFHMAP